MTRITMTKGFASRSTGLLVAAALAVTAGAARGETFVFAFTGHVTSETVLDGNQFVQGPHAQNGGQDVSGTFTFDPTLAPVAGSDSHWIAHGSGNTAVSFVSSLLHFSGGDSFIPALTQPTDIALDSTRVDDENGNTDAIVFTDAASHIATGQQADEHAEFQLSVQESDPAIHDLMQGVTYAQTPNQALVQQFGEGSYFYFKLVANDQGELAPVAYNFGTFSVTSLTLVPEPATGFALLGGCVLMSWVVRRSSARRTCVS